jgi:predicted TIM-barrel fold metal-dependent hydrolase
MRNGFRVIDGDGHMQEPLDIWDTYVEKAYWDRRPKVIDHVGKVLFAYAPCEAFPKGRPKSRPDSLFGDSEERYGEAYRSWWTLATRMAHMDEEGIDVMVGFPTNGNASTTVEIKDPKLMAALCRAYNNWATDYCHDSHGRVQFIAKLPLLDPEEAVAEIARIENRPEMAGVMLSDPGMSTIWSDARFDPVWAKLNDTAIAACFHGGNSQQYTFKPWREAGLAALNHAIAFPVDAMLAMGTMIFGGVLERFPHLRVGFYEANAGWLAWWLSRLDDHAVGRQAGFMYGVAELPMQPSAYFRRQCFVAADADEAELGPVVEYTNGDNILFNSDYPHPDAPFPGSVDKFLAHDIPDEAKRKILWDNSAALYGDRIVATVSV